jgi:hypothetical protein
MGVSPMSPTGVPPVDFSVLGRAETALRLTGKMPVPLHKDFSYTLQVVQHPTHPQVSAKRKRWFGPPAAERIPSKEPQWLMQANEQKLGGI